MCYINRSWTISSSGEILGVKQLLVSNAYSKLMIDKLVIDVITKYTNRDAKNIDHIMIEIQLPKSNEHILQIRWKGVKRTIRCKTS